MCPPDFPLRIVLADDHALVRAGIQALLKENSDFHVVAEAGDGLEALEVIARERPDVALLDLSMPKMSGISVTEQVTARFADVRIVILSMHHHALCVTDAFRAGAKGYVVKEAAAGELEAAIRSVSRGDFYASPAICEALVPRSRAAEAEDLGRKLTPRQTQMLRLIAEGYSTKEAAYRLGISPKTAEVHRAQLMERLGIHDLPTLVRYAMRNGLVSPETFPLDGKTV